NEHHVITGKRLAKCSWLLGIQIPFFRPQYFPRKESHAPDEALKHDCPSARLVRGRIVLWPRGRQKQIAARSAGSLYRGAKGGSEADLDVFEFAQERGRPFPADRRGRQDRTRRVLHQETRTR